MHVHTHLYIQVIAESRDDLSFLTKPQKDLINRAHPNRLNLWKLIVKKKNRKKNISPLSFPD